ncbi:MAG: hypothetical protein A3B96_01290 [Candidatus Spechtbacteria bacterium RIFCSPHIGHO2_02_FULL_43_15b]|uniref:Glycosyl transferase family 1 domain-containing protein n=1 Tax=Candidatus Spechtbacteria bacterium RIFCSPHIGHO2_01_FULL_43_30 TaxID=1802158 RepID=A0A1G2H4W4_9BACT|nr:MAG: hypothetical protein A2827_03690 [Candidatus Spechtbacteria bacterium RIFCSPHIGHO2_01_FULL_43_30]OGZ59046.1 MAG: hypothetical protein A3B96_01290 [Candidatus Spechtbacteria bacterium RIFCSPHIGHO2_02_FULL_43_15b]
MKLFYISSQFVEERQPAGMIQMLYTAREFRRSLGDNFSFIVRGVSDKAIMNAWELPYKVSSCPFRARILFYIFWLPIFWVKQNRLSSKEVLARQGKILYCLDWHAAIAGILYKKIFGYKIAIEYHDPPFGSWKDRVIVRFCDYLLPTTYALKNYLSRIDEKTKQKSWVIPNGIDLEKFANTFSKEECRKKLGLDQNKKIVLYSGNFVARKGIYVLAKAAEFLPDDMLLVMIGGHDPDSISEFKQKIVEKGNIFVGGYKPHDEIPLWIGASDVCVAPNSKSTETEQGRAAIDWTSPMKVFEYMAAKRPIVCSDIPAMREILDSETVIFVEPDNPKALADGIKEALMSREKADRLVKNAFERVSRNTWEKRSVNILKIFENK